MERERTRLQNKLNNLSAAPAELPEQKTISMPDNRSQEELQKRVFELELLLEKAQKDLVLLKGHELMASKLKIKQLEDMLLAAQEKSALTENKKAESAPVGDLVVEDLDENPVRESSLREDQERNRHIMVYLS